MVQLVKHGAEVPALLGLYGHLTNPSVSLLSLQSPIVSLYPLNSPLSLSFSHSASDDDAQSGYRKFRQNCSFLLYCTVLSIMKIQIIFSKARPMKFVNKQGRIHGYLSRVRVGRGSIWVTKAFGKEQWGQRPQKNKKAGLYILEFPPPGGGGKKIKGSGDGEGNQKGKKEKKRNFGENITFYSTKS